MRSRSIDFDEKVPTILCEREAQKKKMKGREVELREEKKKTLNSADDRTRMT